MLFVRLFVVFCSILLVCYLPVCLFHLLGVSVLLHAVLWILIPSGNAEPAEEEQFLDEEAEEFYEQFLKQVEQNKAKKNGMSA
jgi:hypothetical protein